MTRWGGPTDVIDTESWWEQARWGRVVLNLRDRHGDMAALNKQFHD
jgi:hypothetical protein